MVEKIAYKYKFNTLPNIEVLIEECKGHLVTILSKYDKNRNSKAFSYFSVITKNWFIHKAKKLSQQIKKETKCEEISKSVEIEYMSTQNDFIDNNINKEFLEALWREMDQWETLPLKPNELKMLKAMRIILGSAEEIDIFNKKYIYLLAREITNLNTKQVLTNLNFFRKLYKQFRQRWLNEE